MIFFNRIEIRFLKNEIDFRKDYICKKCKSEVTFFLNGDPVEIARINCEKCGWVSKEKIKRK